MQTKHTPGPWQMGQVHNDAPHGTLYNAHSIFPQGATLSTPSIAQVAGLYCGKDADTLLTLQGLTEEYANARLIAAAPELLDILSKILRCHESGNNGAYMGEAVLCEYFAAAARAAILKATGEQS